MTEEEIITALKERWVPREELASMLGLAERQSRVWVENLTQRLLPMNLCVLSTAAKKGYHIPSPTNEEDVKLAEGALQELKSKAISIFERRKPIENFLKKADGQRDIQLTLF